MNRESPQPSDDPEVLLRSGLRDTTPEFERRWIDLKRHLRLEPAPRAATPWRRWGWRLMPAGLAAAVAVWLLVLDRGGTPRLPAAISPEFAAYGELFALDADLRGALPLTDRESVDDLLIIPAPDHS